MSDANLLRVWASYVDELSACGDACTRSEERQLYVQHLAAAAAIGSQLVQNHHRKATLLVMSEQRNFGTSFLSGSAGERAEKALAAFAKCFPL